MAVTTRRAIIISNGKRKREIELPFGICGGREELTAVRDSIDAWLSDPGNGVGITYGWCRVDSPRRQPDVFGPHHTMPEPWDS